MFYIYLEQMPQPMRKVVSYGLEKLVRDEDIKLQCLVNSLDKMQLVLYRRIDDAIMDGVILEGVLDDYADWVNSYVKSTSIASDDYARSLPNIITKVIYEFHNFNASQQGED